MLGKCAGHAVWQKSYILLYLPFHDRLGASLVPRFVLLSLAKSRLRRRCAMEFCHLSKICKGVSFV